MMPKFYAYARVSHKEQEAGDSIAGQKSRGLKYWESNFKDEGVEWAGVFEEPGHVSGRSVPFSRRKAGKEAMTRLQAGDYLFVDKVDRLWRDIHDFSDLLRGFKNHQITVVFGNLMGASFKSDSPMGDFMLGLLVLIGRLESDQMSDRILANFKHQKENGFFPHKKEKAPLGMMAIFAVPQVRTVTGKLKKMLAWDMDKRLLFAEIVKLHDVDGKGFDEISTIIEGRFSEYVSIFMHARKWQAKRCAWCYLLEKHYQMIRDPRYIAIHAIPKQSDAGRFLRQKYAEAREQKRALAVTHRRSRAPATPATPAALAVRVSDADAASCV